MTNQQTTAPDTKKESRAAQIVLSLIIFVGFAVLLFVPDAALADTGLYRLIFDNFKTASEIQFLNIAYYAFTGFYALLLIFTVISLFVKKKAAFALNCIKALAGIVVFTFFIYVNYAKVGASLAEMFKDEKTYIALNSTFFSLVFGLFMLFVLSLSYYKGKGCVKCVGGLIGLAYASMLFYDRAFIGDHVLLDFFNINFSYGEGALATVISYSFIALAYAAAANAALALLALAIRKMGGLDLVRSVVMFVLSAVCFIFFVVEDSFSTLSDHLGIVIFLGLSLVQLIYTIIVFAVSAAKKAKKKNEPVFVTESDNQMAFAGFGKATVQPAAEEAPAEAASEDAARVNAALDDAAQISIEDIVAQNREKEETESASSYDGAIRDEAPQGEEIEEEKEFNFEQKQHDGVFNREFTDYEAAEEARRQQAAQAAQQAAQQASQQYGAQSNGQTPYAGGMPYYGAGYAQQYAQNAPGYYGGPIPYLPDAFINSLTPAERDEFDKLFISRVYGENKRLPVYTIGADNREFFAKVFVFMGRYRTIISEGLLEKIYNYSNSIR